MSLPKYNPAHATAYAIGVMRSIRNLRISRLSVPDDAATRRTPEADAPDPEMRQLVIPSDYEVRRLINEARSIEVMGEAAYEPHERDRAQFQATALRTKAIAIHLGIEE